MDIPLVIDTKIAGFSNGENEVLSNISFALAEAEMCYLIGKSGSGKSTFLKTIFGAQPLSSGVATVVGFQLEALQRKEIPLLRRKIGMVFQDFHLFDKWTIRQNLDYVLKATDWKNASERENRVVEVAKSVQLLNKIDTPIHNLSGGEQQKVVIARAILNDPELIIADEPTGNLDPETSEMIMHTLYNVAKKNKTAILIATHDYTLIKKFPARVFRCDNGGIEEVEDV